MEWATMSTLAAPVAGRTLVRMKSASSTAVVRFDCRGRVVEMERVARGQAVGDEPPGQVTEGRGIPSEPHPWMNTIGSGVGAGPGAAEAVEPAMIGAARVTRATQRTATKDPGHELPWQDGEVRTIATRGIGPVSDRSQLQLLPSSPRHGAWSIARTQP